MKVDDLCGGSFFYRYAYKIIHMSPSQPLIWEGRLEHWKSLQYLSCAFEFAEVLLEQPFLCDW